MTEYVVRRKVIGFGKNSLAITLPKVWTQAMNVSNGQTVLLKFDDYHFLKIVPEDNVPFQKESQKCGEGTETERGSD